MKWKLTSAVLLLAACTDPVQSVRPPLRANASLSSGESATPYVIVFSQTSGIPKGARFEIEAAGGTVVSQIPELGAIAATSNNPEFAADIASLPSVKAVSEDRPVQMIPRGEGPDAAFAVVDAAETGPSEPPGSDPQPGTEPLYNQQWDKMRMNASATGSYAVQPGRRDVVVGIIDTGVEILPVAHPDIAPNLDVARSRSFNNPAFGVAGDPNPTSWDDKFGHGSWCASAVAAPINAIGISGVAPNVTLVALKAIGDAGTGTYLALAQALVYSGLNHFDVVSMSLGGYVPHSKGEAVIDLVQRAVDFARANGVTPVAALSNENWDLSDGSFFQSFELVPGELPGVIGVAATTYTNKKAFYSNYGTGKTDVSAPGGGSTTFDPMPPSYFGNGRVVGAWSFEGLANAGAFRFKDCTPGPGGACWYYAWVRGTSMATPNAAGVAALIVSQYGDFDGSDGRKPHMSPTRVESILQQTANNQPCTDNIGGAYTALGYEANCKGTAGGYTNFFGKGIVDALKAVTQ
jgi:lantibiotic leader peptide-processing serine protease